MAINLKKAVLILALASMSGCATLQKQCTEKPWRCVGTAIGVAFGCAVAVMD